MSDKSERKFDAEMPKVRERREDDGFHGSTIYKYYSIEDIEAMRSKAQDVIDGLRAINEELCRDKSTLLQSNARLEAELAAAQQQILTINANAADNYAASENRLHECEGRLAKAREEAIREAAQICMEPSAGLVYSRGKTKWECAQAILALLEPNEKEER